MPTVIDSLIVELGLDPKKFTAGQKAALDAFKKTSDEAKQRAKEMEESARRSANFFSKVRNEAIGLFAALAGAAGIKNFVGNLVAGDAATGRFARTIGESSAEVAKWGKAIELAGGAAGAGQATLGGLNDQIQAFRAGLGGNILPIYNQMAAEGGKVIDINASISEQLLAIARNARAIEARQAGRGGFFLRQLGLGEDAINVLIRGDKYTQGLLDEAERLGAAIKKDTDAAEKFLGTWRTTGQLIEGLVRPLESVIAPVIDSLNDALKRASENQKEQYSRGPGAGQDKFNGWMNYIFGIKPNAGPTSTAPGAGGAAVPVQGGIFGGLGFKPLEWDALTRPGAISGLPVGGAGAAAAGAVNSRSSTSTTEININGPITVTTNATDAEGVASKLTSALADVAKKRRLAAMANSGQE